MQRPYDFKTYAPFNQSGRNFPKSIIRLSKTSLVISGNIMEIFQIARISGEQDETEFIRLVFGIDHVKQAIRITPSDKGYLLKFRSNGNAYMNITRQKSFGLPIGDYKLASNKDLIFRLAK